MPNNVIFIAVALLFSAVNCIDYDKDATFDLSLAFDAALKETVSELSYSQLNYDFRQTYDSRGIDKSYLSYRNIVTDAITVIPKARFPEYENLIISTINEDPQLYKKALQEPYSLDRYTTAFAKKIYFSKKFKSTSNALLRILNKPDSSKGDKWSADLKISYRQDQFISGDSLDFEEKLMEEIFAHIYTNYRQATNEEMETYAKKCEVVRQCSKSIILKVTDSPLDHFNENKDIFVTIGGFPKNPYKRLELYGDSIITMPYDQTETSLFYRTKAFIASNASTELYDYYFNAKNYSSDIEGYTICTSRYIDSNIFNYNLGSALFKKKSENFESVFLPDESGTSILMGEDKGRYIESVKKVENGTVFTLKMYKSWQNMDGSCDVYIGDQIPLLRIYLSDSNFYTNNNYIQRFGYDGIHNSLWPSGKSQTVTYSALIRPTFSSRMSGNSEFKNAFTASYMQLITARSTDSTEHYKGDIMYDSVFKTCDSNTESMCNLTKDIAMPDTLKLQTSASVFPEFDFITSGGLMEKIIGKKLGQVLVEKVITAHFTNKNGADFFYDIIKNSFYRFGEAYSAQLYSNYIVSEKDINVAKDLIYDFGIILDDQITNKDTEFDFGPTLLDIRLVEVENNKHESIKETVVKSYDYCYWEKIGNKILIIPPELSKKNNFCKFNTYTDLTKYITEYIAHINKNENPQMSCRYIYLIPEALINSEWAAISNKVAGSQIFKINQNYYPTNLSVKTIFNKDETLKDMEEAMNAKGDTENNRNTREFNAYVLISTLLAIYCAGFILSLWLTGTAISSYPAAFHKKK